MSTFLLTWNPDRWKWHDLKKLSAQNIRGKKVRLSWSTGKRKSIRPGDRFFMLQQGTKGRGIIGKGIFVSEVFLDRHFDDQKQDQDANFAKIEFERLVDPRSQPERRYDITKLKQLSGGSAPWNAQSSGTIISEELAERLEKEWTSNFIGYPDGVTREDVLGAISSLRRGDYHPFADSTKHDVLFEGERYPLKAVAGLAARRAAGRDLTPYDFQVGKGSKCFRIISSLGFKIVPKQKPSEAAEDVLLESADDSQFPEGKRLLVEHMRRERNQQVVRKKKSSVYRRHGKLECEICSFDFFEMYGEIGKEFAECHHTKPISEMAEDAFTKLDDLLIVCSNCHRMLHRRNPALTISDLRSRMRNQSVASPAIRNLS